MIATEKNTDAALLLQQGITAAKAGDKAAAGEALKRVVVLEPRNDTAWIWLAAVQDDLAAVAYCLQRALEINPSNQKTADALRTIQARQAAEAQSATAPPPSPSLAPDYPAPYASKEAAAEWQWPPAEGYVQELNGGAQSGPLQTHETDPAVDVPLPYDELKRRGIVAGKGGRREEARSYLLAATELNDTDPETWHWLATVVDDPEDKQIALENVLTLDPFNAAAQAEIRENAFRLAHSREDTPSVPLDQRSVEQPAADLPVGPEYWPTAPIPVVVEHRPQSPPEQRTPLASRLIAGAAGVERQGAASNPDAPEIGQYVGGPYLVLNVVQGTAGPEYPAWQAGTERFYVLRPQKCDPADLKKARAHYTVYRNVPYTIVPMSTQGLSLRGLSSVVGRMPPELAVRYGRSLLQQLVAEHAKGPVVTARTQLTPDTVGFDQAGELRLEPGDLVSHAPAEASWEFLPPEQADNGAPSLTSDIFAAGALMFFMLTGSPPPKGRDLPRKQGDAVVPEYFPGHPKVPPSLVKVLATALQPNPADRYASAQEMVAALEATGIKGAAVRGSMVPVALAAAAVLVVGLLGFLVTSGKLELPSLGGNQNQAAMLLTLPTPTPAPPTATPLPPVPFDRVEAHSVDTRRFPTNALFFSALDSTGSPIMGLSTASVALTDNGANVTNLQLTELRHTTDPVSLIFAVDNSMQMAGRPLDDAKTAIHVFSERLQPGDQMALLTYGGQGRYLVDYTVSKTEFLTAVDAIQPTGKADIFPAMLFAADRTATQPQGGYTALIVITNSPLPVSEPVILGATRAAGKANLPVFVVGLEKETWRPQVAERLASSTGGAAVVADKPDAGGASEALKKLDTLLHQVYKLSYDATSLDTSGEHTVQLSVTANGSTHEDMLKYWVLRR